MSKPKDDITISVIVPVHKPGVELDLCLNALTQHGSKAHEVILVLDGIKAEDGLSDELVDNSFHLVHLAGQNGPAVARNKGAQEASGDVLLFIDSDVQIKAGLIEKLRNHFTKTDAEDAVIGSYDDSPYATSVVSKYRNLLHHYTHQQASSNASTFWGACGAIRKAVFMDVGGFSTSFEKPSVEDIDLGYRLGHHGYSIKLDKTLQIKHLKNWSLANTIRTDVFYRAKPWTLLLHQYKNLGIGHLNVSYEERLASLCLSLGLACLVLIPWLNFAPLLSISLLGALLLLKSKTYLFFLRHFSLYKLPLVILLHWGYLLSGLVGFVLGTIEYYFQSDKSPSEIMNEEKELEQNLMKEVKA